MLALCKEIVLFLIMAKMIEGFVSGNKYGKFIKLIISLIIVLKLISPIFSIFDGDFDLTAAMNEIEQQLMIVGTDESGLPNEEIQIAEITPTEIEVEEVVWEK